MAHITEARPREERAGSASDASTTEGIGNRLAPTRAALSPAFEVSARPKPLQRIRHLWQYRELLGNLVRKELKVKYKNSILGFVWSLLNPLMYLIVFSLVFGAVLNVKVPYYGLFFLAGLLAWNFFSAAVMGGTSSIVMNAQLVTKVWFPRETLPLAAAGAALVHFFLQSIVLLGACLVFQREPSLRFLPALPLAMVVLFVFSAALAIGLSAINVYLRDTQHLMEVVLLAWFWMTPIAYQYDLVAKRLVEHFGPRGEWAAALNPMLMVVITFQRVLWNGAEPNGVLPVHGLRFYITHLGVGLVASIVLLYGALRLFSRLEDNFAEEI